MKKIVLLILLLPMFSHAQLEKVFVETYYISDDFDSTDVNGGHLKTGSVTYRIFIDLVPGSKLQSIYGDANHALRFASTDTFFNNIDRGQTFAFDISKSHYGDNTTALDTWLTLGQTAKYSASGTNFGIPQTLDDNGSFIGGSNNDGGSAGIAAGLLNNTAAGIPLTVADGMDTLMLPAGQSFFQSGIVDLSGNDSTIFGDLVAGTQFCSYNAGLVLTSGASGTNADSNYVLVAQLTTLGEISFEINVGVIDTLGNVIKYVANDSVLLSGEVLNRYLKYPYAPVCGCPDPNYLEYLSNRDCDNLDMCQTLVVFGCMDTLACNYNPGANYHLQTLCCYPGYCSDRDIAVVCPQLHNEKLKGAEINFSPNPVDDKLTLRMNPKRVEKITYMITDAYGRKIRDGRSKYGESAHEINCSGLQAGIYFIKISGSVNTRFTFIKN